jgi:MarR family transcriptional regulator for hemolysin
MNQSADNTFFYMLHDVTRQVRKHFDRRATRLELTRAQWRALKATGRHEGLSQSELAEYLDMEAIPVGRVIDRLEKTGFVERRADPADRRRWRLYLTPKAHAVVGEMEVIADELRDDALRGIGRDDLDTLMSVLNRIKENLATLDAPPEEERKVS